MRKSNSQNSEILSEMIYWDYMIVLAKSCLGKLKDMFLHNITAHTTLGGPPTLIVDEWKEGLPPVVLMWLDFILIG